MFRQPPQDEISAANSTAGLIVSSPYSRLSTCRLASGETSERYVVPRSSFV